ncbi:MAG: hypothetical protein LBC52_02555 [Treponema sp.]|jgi:hypothetical protein|nr:hypothetical protein [Treponema sp.]
MSRLCRFFIILILACTVVGCSEPEDTFLFTITRKLQYNKGETFTPNSDLKVYTSSEGEDPKEVKPLSQVNISIAEPKYLLEDVKPVSDTTAYKLENEGTYLVIVEYNGLKAVSPLVVVSKGPEIIVEWAK